jgi:hypothetical protein
MMEVRFGTSTAGGGFAPYAAALIDALKSVDPILDIKPINTKGATDNAERLQRGDLDIGLVSGEVMHEWLSEHPDQPKLRVISVIYSTPGIFAVRPDTRYHRIRDLLGRSIVWNPRGTGSAVQARYVMQGLGLDMDRDFDPIYPESFADGPTMVIERRAAALWGQRLPLAGLHRAHQPAGRRPLRRADRGGDCPDPRQVSVPRRAHGAGRHVPRPVRAAHHRRGLELHARPARSRRRDRLPACPLALPCRALIHAVQAHGADDGAQHPGRGHLA